MDLHHIVRGVVRDRNVEEGIDLRRTGERHLALLDDEPLAVGAGEATHDVDRAAEHERLGGLFGDLHVAPHLDRRAGAIDPGVARDIHTNVGLQER
jgi:hypothetical protein